MKENIILFDLDGTLIDSTDAIVSTFHHAFNELGFDFQGTDEDIKDLIGYPLEIMFQDLGVEQERAFEFVASYKKRYKEISKEQTLLLEQSIEALKLAKSFARLSVVTTKTGKYTIPLLEHMNILDYFEHVTGYEDVQNHKPHPEPILSTLDKMDIAATSNIWMIGDTKLDLMAANHAGVNSVGVLCGYGKEHDLKEHTTFIAPNALEAIKIIQDFKV